MVRLPLALLCLTPVAAAAGSIKGTVLFEGEPPAQRALERGVDPRCARGRSDEAVVVTRGKLRDVVVRIANGTAGKHTAPATPVFIDQKDCMYTPRVVAMAAGQKLLVRNSDQTFHNVWGVVKGRDLFNKPQPAEAADLQLDPSSARPGDVVELACGVHGWMRAYVAVHDHPYVAVTGADGAFEIKNLPVGSYTLEAWHPELGTRSMKVQIGKGKRGDVTARFSYKAGDR